MNKVTLQVPMSKALKTSAKKVANEYGFSSLQETVRVLLTQFANKSVTLSFQSTQDEILTPEQEKILTKKYKKVRKEIAQGKGFTVHSVDEMMPQLRS